MKKIIGIAITCCILFFIKISFGLSSDFKENTLIVGHIAFPPFYLSNDTGMDADIIKLIAKKAGFSKITFVSFDNLKQLFLALKTGKINIVANGIVKTKNRSNQYLLTDPYYIRGGLGVLYLKEKLVFKNTSDFKNRKIGVLKDSYPSLWLKEKNIIPKSVKSYDTIHELISALKQHKIDIIISNYTLTKYYQDKDPHFRAALIQNIPIVFLLRKEDESLGVKLNKAIEKSWKDQSLYFIKSHYLIPLGIRPAKQF